MQFQEQQRFSPKLLGAAAAPAAVLLMLALWMTPAEDRPIAAFVALLPIAFIAAFDARFQLRTRVEDGELHVGFPFGLRRSIPLSDIATAELIRYRPLRDFGGWGLRLSREGTMYSASGDRAVKLTLTAGEVIFVGSQRPDDLARALAGGRRTS